MLSSSAAGSAVPPRPRLHSSCPASTPSTGLGGCPRAAAAWLLLPPARHCTWWRARPTRSMGLRQGQDRLQSAGLQCSSTYKSHAKPARQMFEEREPTCSRPLSHACGARLPFRRQPGGTTAARWAYHVTRSRTSRAAATEQGRPPASATAAAAASDAVQLALIPSRRSRHDALTPDPARGAPGSL